MKPRWWKRLWLRYLYYCREHWLMAGALSAAVLWGFVEVAIQLLPFVLQVVFEFVMALFAAV